MIKIENTVLTSPEQMEFVIQGMRNPMDSWKKSDSMICDYGEDCDICEMGMAECGIFYLGDNDRSLMRRLAKAGKEHRKYMRMMPAYARITAPLYW